MTKLIYLASPYTHDNKNIMKTRLVKIGKLAAKLFKKGMHVFPVMSATASMAKYGNMNDTTWASWRDLDLNYLSRCDEIYISMLDKEWYKSVGMKAELEYAIKNGITARLIDRKGNIVKYKTDADILEIMVNLLDQDESESIKQSIKL